MLSLLCQRYHWAHDFWRRMGIQEFWQWVDQVYQETEQERKQGDSWSEADNDPRWQYMREKRERRRGR